MRTLVFIIAVLALLQSTLPQAHAGLDFSSMPIEKVRAIVKAAVPGVSGFEIVEAALKSRRHDVILACMDVFETSATLSQKVWKMEDCYLKGQLLVLDLRHGKFWDDGHPLRLNNEQSMQAEFFLPMVRQYLPETPIDYDVISSPERRNALADKLEVAVRKKWGVIEGDPASEEKHEGLIPAQMTGSAIRGKSLPPPIQLPAPKEASDAKPAVPAPSKEPASSSTPWGIIVVLIVAATGLLWLLFKRRS